MFFTDKQAAHLSQECRKALQDLQDLQLKIVVQGQPLDAAPRLTEHLLHGAGRRVGVIRRAIENVFSLFPPETKRPLQSDALADVQINLHAFVMNLYGIYDNWAWAYVLRHDLESTIGDRRRIGLFHNATRDRLPSPLRTYLASPTTTEWHEKYAKSYRDALAHRIPPYLPPAQFRRTRAAATTRWKTRRSSASRQCDGTAWTRSGENRPTLEYRASPSFTHIAKTHRRSP
jgi:hypothetical protein